MIASCVVCTSAATAAEQTNVVLIFVDDLDYGDPGCYGGKKRLFRLTDDPGESRDLSAEKPQIVQGLHQAWNEWSEPLPPAVSTRDKQTGQ